MTELFPFGYTPTECPKCGTAEVKGEFFTGGIWRTAYEPYGELRSNFSMDPIIGTLKRTCDVCGYMFRTRTKDQK